MPKIMAVFFLLSGVSFGVVNEASAFCLYSCYPSEADARSVFENDTLPHQYGENTKVIVKSFKKTDGQEITGMGITAYRIFYSAVVELPEGQVDTIGQAFHIPGTPRSEYVLNPGTVQEFKDWNMIFEKSEKGWRGQDGKVY